MGGQSFDCFCSVGKVFGLVCWGEVDGVFFFVVTCFFCDDFPRFFACLS